MSRLGCACGIKGESFPRVSGDEPTEPTWQKDTTPFSPRERG